MLNYFAVDHGHKCEFNNSLVTGTEQQYAALSQQVSVHARDLRIVYFRSNQISNRIGRPIRFRIKSSNRIGRIPCKP